MRRALLALVLLASSLLLSFPASAHGSPGCGLVAREPVAQRDPGAMYFIAKVTCYPVHTISLDVWGYRRTPGQPWVQIAFNHNATPYAMLEWSNVISAAGWNCAKDYMTTANYGAAPGTHGGWQSTIRYAGAGC